MSQLQTVAIQPRVAGLNCSHVMPAEWRQVSFPEEDLDFSQPVFLPLSVSMAPYAAVVFSVAARPAFSDGAVYEWMMYLVGREDFEIQGAMPVRIGGTEAVECRAIQQTEAGPMRMCIVMFEDGGRLFNLTAMAPAAIWDSIEPAFDQIFDSFRIEDPRGATAPLVPGQAPPASSAAEPSQAF